MDQNQLVPPPGFVLDAPPPPPPGFVLERATAAAPAPPPGFVLDAPAPVPETTQSPLQDQSIEPGTPMFGGVPVPGMADVAPKPKGNIWDFIQKNLTEPLLTGPAEGIVSLVSGLGAYPIGAAAGVGKTLLDAGRAAYVPFRPEEGLVKTREKVTEAIPYRPTTETGAALTSLVGAPGDVIGEGLGIKSPVARTIANAASPLWWFNTAIESLHKAVDEIPRENLPAGLQQMNYEDAKALMKSFAIPI